MRQQLAACVFACALLFGSGAAAQSKPGIFDADRDIGDVSVKGSLAYDGKTGTYTVTSSGANIWAEKDAFHYAWTRASGDLHIATDFGWIVQGKDTHRKAGVMIRQNLTPGSPYADVMIHGDGMTCLQYRVQQDGPTC